MKNIKWVIQVLVAVMTGASALAQTFPVVVPGGLANTEGNSSITEPFNSSSFRMQMVIDASQFAFLGNGTGLINSISFRIDDSATGGATYSFGGSIIQLSTTQKTPDSLSPVFSENIGSDAKTVWNHAIAFGRTYSPGQSPQPFNTAGGIPISFLYSPSMGNLLLDIGAGGGETIFAGGIDAHTVSGDSVSRVFANSEFATTGTLDSAGLVTRFSITVVPEPSAWLLLFGGLAFLSIFRRR